MGCILLVLAPEACSNASVAQQVGLVALSNSLFYALALKSVRPRSHTQQIFKARLGHSLSQPWFCERY